MTQPLIPPGILAPSQAQSLVNYGTDFDCTNDWNPARVLITGRRLLVQALYRRYITRRGRLIYDLNYGTCLQDMIDDAMGPGDMVRKSQQVAAEALKDDRVTACTCVGTFTPSTGVLQFATVVTDGVGPFPLTLAVTSLTLAILSPPP